MPRDRKLKKVTEVRIPIIAERLRGEPDDDYSVKVPVDGVIAGACGVDMPGKPLRVNFYWDRNGARQFPAVSVGDGSYLVWIAERHEWVGVYCKETGSYFEGDYWGREVSLSVAGPLPLNEAHGSAILRACNLPGLSETAALTTSPSILSSSGW